MKKIENKVMLLKGVLRFMTMKEERIFRHVIARMESVRHKDVEILSKVEVEGKKSKVVARIKWFKNGYLFEGGKVVEGWRIL